MVSKTVRVPVNSDAFGNIKMKPQAPLDDEVHEYVACLLVIGPPVTFAQPVDTHVPISSLDYMNKCGKWFANNVRGSFDAGWFAKGHYEVPHDFHNWYARYKTWLMREQVNAR